MRVAKPFFSLSSQDGTKEDFYFRFRFSTSHSLALSLSHSPQAWRGDVQAIEALLAAGATVDLQDSESGW